MRKYRKLKHTDRKALETYMETRGIFTGTFVRTGWKNGYKEPLQTILLVNIKNDKGQVLCDHLWFNYTKGFEKCEPLFEGDILEFHARTSVYVKGYMGYRDDVYDKPIESDYKLSYPTKVRKIFSAVESAGKKDD